MNIAYNQLLTSTEYGGAADIAFRIARNVNLRAPGRSTLWLPGPGRAADKAGEAALPVQWYDPPDIQSGSKTHAAKRNVSAGLKLRCQRPGLLHVHTTLLYGGLPWACALSGLKRIVHIQLRQDAETFRWALKVPPELIITCAEFLVDEIRRALPEKTAGTQPIVAVPNCVDTDVFYPGDRRAAKQAIGADVDVPLLLMLANLAPHKGQETAIRTVARLKQRGVKVVCWLAGVERQAGQGYQARLERLIEESQVGDRVELLGFRSDGAELLRAADFFLLPSTHEGLPVSVLEAQASKVPVLAADTDGIPEAVRDGETGYLIPAGDDAGYADRLEQLIKHPEICRAVADRAYEHCTTTYNERSFCERIWQLYQQVLTGTPGVEFAGA